MTNQHFKILCKPKNKTYIDAKNPRFFDGFVFWFDDSDRERAAKAVNLIIADSGVWSFFNPDKNEEITFVPVGFIADKYWENPDKLILTCESPDQDKAYFRPFLCKGNPSKSDVFIVGINPATPIKRKQISENEYIKLLSDYDAFMEYYKSLRMSQGKSEMSYTREGIDSLGRWLASITNSVVLETNVIAYPTPKEDDLDFEPEYIKVQGKEFFIKLLLGIQPGLVILHSLSTVKEFAKVLDLHGMIEDNSFYKHKKINDLESSSPILTFNYSNGKKCAVFVCRHLKNYRTTGKSYEMFRNKIQKFLSEQSQR